MTKKVFIKTFGCQMNEYDSNRILDTIKNIGYIKTEKLLESNCYILNTCHIRDKAKEKVYHEIGRVKQNFQGKEKPLVIVAGVLHKQIYWSKRSLSDFVIGPQSYHKINNKEFYKK